MCLAEIAEPIEMTTNEITYEIRGAIYDVYKELGPGLLEKIYEEALVYELQQRGLKVERQKPIPIIYKGKEIDIDLRLDLLVDDEVVVELKSVSEMKDVFYKQTLTYLRLLNKKVGLLVNFNVENILDGAIIRVVNKFEE
jgi:GxxExxY protein